MVRLDDSWASDLGSIPTQVSKFFCSVRLIRQELDSNVEFLLDTLMGTVSPACRIKQESIPVGCILPASMTTTRCQLTSLVYVPLLGIPNSSPCPHLTSRPSPFLQILTLPKKASGTRDTYCPLPPVDRTTPVKTLPSRNFNLVFSKWRYFRRIRWIKQIRQNHPCMNRIQLQPHTSTENILV